MRRGGDMRPLRPNVGKNGTGDDCLHSRQCPRLFGIDRYDPSMGMRAPLDAAPQHTRHSHIGAEIGPACNLVDVVGADRPGADYPKRGLVEIAHLHSPVVAYEAGHGITNRRCTRLSGNSLARQWSPAPPGAYIHFPTYRLINNQNAPFYHALRDRPAPRSPS